MLKIDSIHYQVIPHNKQRYNTVGDYWEDKEAVNFRVSSLKNAKYEVLVFIHELIEYLLVKVAKISIKDIDNFDINYKDYSFYNEPGDNPAAPYHRQHVTATIIERIVSSFIGVNWKDYNECLDRVEKTWKGGVKYD